MKKLLNLFKHKHKWKSQMSCNPFDGLYAEGWDYYYKCKCGAIKRKYIGKKEEIKELKEEGKSQEIPLFEGTMEQLDNLTILKEEGKE